MAEILTAVSSTAYGLYICKNFIEALGGPIRVDDTLGSGSTLSFALVMGSSMAKRQPA